MTEPYYQDEYVTLHHGDCRDVLATLPDASVDAVVTDPPYELAFMGKGWDSSGIAFDVAMWAEVLRVLKPGGHLLAFGGTRTFHRVTVAIEDAGFEVRDCMSWLYGSGFPKSLDVSKAIDKAAGAEREVVGFDASKARPNKTRHAKAMDGVGYHRDEVSGVQDNGATITAPATADAERWQGWGTALKPAHEPICLARKPLVGTVAANVLEHGTGALNIDGCRIGTEGGGTKCTHRDAAGTCLGHPTANGSLGGGIMRHAADGASGRWPANVVLDEDAAAMLDVQSGTLTSGRMAAGTAPKGGRMTYGQDAASGYVTTNDTPGDSGGASRFFYVAKAPASERPKVDGKAHATVKPLTLMRWLVRLVTPPGGHVLDPFAGSGTTAEACIVEGFTCTLIEKDADHLPLITERLAKPIQPTMFGAS